MFTRTDVTSRTKGRVPRSLFMILAGMLLAFGITDRAHAQLGQAGVVFLMIEPDSRAAGMGNAGVALADNASANFWNPAGLAYQQGTEVALTHSNWLPEFDAGLFYEYLVAKHHVPGWGTFGANVTYLFLGEHEQRDETNTKLGEFKAYDLAVGTTYGTKLSENLALGVGLRLIYSNLAGGTTVGGQETNPGISAGVDVAGLYRTSPFELGGVPTTFSAGFNLANMGPKIQYSDSEQADPIPTNLRFGYAFTFDLDEYNKITVVNDFTKMLVNRDSTGADPFYKAIFSSWSSIQVQSNAASDEDAEFKSISPLQQLTIGTGLEYWYDNLFALRSGFFYENPDFGDRQFLTFGAGLRYNIIGVDFSYIYALEENHPLSDTMRFSLLVSL